MSAVFGLGIVAPAVNSPTEAFYSRLLYNHRILPSFTNLPVRTVPYQT